MAAIAYVSFPSIGHCSDRKVSVPAARSVGPTGSGRVQFKTPNLCSRLVVRCSVGASYLPPTVSETKSKFLKSYKRPIPSIYSSVLQELLVQQHLMRYKKTYQYDAVFALGFVTVYEQLMEGYPSSEDEDAIFKAYIQALNEDPEKYRYKKTYQYDAVFALGFVTVYEQLMEGYPSSEDEDPFSRPTFRPNEDPEKYRSDARKLEEWARTQNSTSLADFSSRKGEVEEMLKGISERAQGKGNFSYSRFFAIGLFRLLELANATEPTVLEKLCAALNINKRSVDRDLDVYRNLLSKLVQAKELLKEYVDREKKKREERVGSQKANEAITKCVGDFLYARH